jgi:hypothetical protein
VTWRSLWSVPKAKRFKNNFGGSAYDRDKMIIDFADSLFLSPRTKERAEKRRSGRYPVPARSGRLYIVIKPSQVHMFRFLLEAQDNLGIMTVVDRWRAVLLLRFSPHQEKTVREFLESMQESLSFSTVRMPKGTGAGCSGSASFSRAALNGASQSENAVLVMATVALAPNSYFLCSLPLLMQQTSGSWRL